MTEDDFEEGLSAVDAAFEERGFFRRLLDVVTGLGKPHDTFAYRRARQDLPRLAAPLLAILLPVLGVVVLLVVTSVKPKDDAALVVEIARAVDEEMPLEEEAEEEIPDETVPPPEEIVEIQIDAPTVAPVSEIVSTSAAPTPPMPVSVKPAAKDSVALIRSPVKMRAMAGSRNPGSIGAMTRGGAGYGDAATEAAVLKALRWLKKTQLPNGSWENGSNRISNTALAILAYLAHGETPGSKEFGETVEKAMQYLIDALKTKKDRTGCEVVSFRGTDRNEYATLIATYALCETYGMTRNPNAKKVALQTLQRIVDNQSPTGGWDYGLNRTSSRDDMSYGGWALQALKAGKMAGLKPEGLDECIKKAVKCLKTRNFRDGGFNYTAGGKPTGLTATGCLAMQLLGYMNENEVREALNTMRHWKPSFEGAPKGTPLSEALPGANPQYYCYYAAQCKYQAGMCKGAAPENVKAWQEWNQAMKALYPATIITPDETILGLDGRPRAIGYWTFQDATCGGSNAKTLATCLAALQMMVYYRYLPTTQTKAAEVEVADDTEESSVPKGMDVDVEVDI